MQNLTSQRVVAASLHILPDPRPESTRGYAHQPPNNTSPRLLKTGLPSNTHSKSILVSQELQHHSHLRGWWSPIWRGSWLSDLESLKPRYTWSWTSEQPSRPAPSSWLEAGVCTPLERLPLQTWGPSSGPNPQPQHSTAYSPARKAGDLGGETAF